MGRVSLSSGDVETYLCIEELIAKKGYPPTYRDIGNELGISLTAVRARLSRLEQRGYISRIYRGHRSIAMLKPIIASFD